MDLKIDAEKIRSLRLEKAWSQEHLAHVTGLGRRTIQRVEKTGTASFETAQAIAAVLDLKVSDLMEMNEIHSNAIITRNSLLRKIYVVLTTIGLLLLFALGRSAIADYVKLDIAAIVDEQHQSKASITNEEGEEALIQLMGNYRISITPSITSIGDVQLELVLMKRVDEEYIEIAGPIIRTPDGETAQIRSATDDGKTLTLEITPSIL